MMISNISTELDQILEVSKKHNIPITGQDIVGIISSLSTQSVMPQISGILNGIMANGGLKGGECKFSNDTPTPQENFVDDKVKKPWNDKDIVCTSG